MAARETTNTVRVSFVDVAQGDSIVGVDSHSGTAIVIDCPTFAADLTEDALRAAGGVRIQALILTHLHADHIGDVLELTERLPVARIRTNLASNPRASAQTIAVLRALAELEDDGVDVQPATAGVREAAGAMTYRILAPTHAWALASATRGNPNRGCVVSVLEAHESRWLLASDATGDVWDRLLERQPENLPASVLQLPHHGGRLASQDDVAVVDRLVRAVAPRDVVVSVGLTNSHGHPRVEHLEVAARQANLMCTQINAACQGRRGVPTAQARALPAASYAAGGHRGVGCSCAGTIEYAAGPGRLTVSPTSGEHATVVDALETPHCRLP
jgi:competence protein ComEC